MNDDFKHVCAWLTHNVTNICMIGLDVSVEGQRTQEVLLSQDPHSRQTQMMPAQTREFTFNVHIVKDAVRCFTSNNIFFHL